MESTIIRIRKRKVAFTMKPKETKKIITEDDIRKRAFEISRENNNSSTNDLDNWFYAERELNGYYN